MYNLRFALSMCLALASGGRNSPAEDLQTSLLLVADAMHKIDVRWQVEEFPVFLKVAWMFGESYEKMKDKLKLKLATSLRGGQEFFTASFTGSSVTAGHDNQFAQSYPMLIGNILRPVFAAVHVNVTIRNVAMGNNPCMPYDICVRTFAGDDADIVLWEQSYNCHPSDKGYLYEQFVRQALLMPSRPIIAFSDSNTPNWHISDCMNVSTAPPTHSAEHLQALKAKLGGNERYLFSTLNKANERHWGRLIWDFMGRYKAAGIQTFLHKLYEKFRCKGPYLPAWKGKNVMWHPSPLGHELRAGHIAYVWLAVLRDALQDVLDMIKSGDSSTQLLTLALMHNDLCKNNDRAMTPSCLKAISTDLNTTIDTYERAKRSKWSHLLPSPVYKNENISDGMQCFTNYRPRADEYTTDLMSITKRVVSNNVLLADRPGKLPYIKGWTLITFEYIYMPHLMNKTSAAGYLDFKVILYGNNISKPLDIAINVSKAGKIYLCDVPSIPPKMLNSFHANLKGSGLRLFLSKLQAEAVSFDFNEENAMELHYFGNIAHSDDRCIQSTEMLGEGSYILTISPQSLKYVTIGTLLVP